MADNKISSEAIAAPIDNPTKRIGKPIPREGQDGKFSESWFPICTSQQLPLGGLRGENFLDGRVVAYRGDDGVARVVSAYCPHLGADLSVGCVVEDRLQCAFHQWEYDVEGHCAKTAIGDEPPKNARLYRFPTVEHYGVVWAFNGKAPHWELPTFTHPSDQIKYRCFRVEGLFNCDPWVFAANTPDMQHIKVVHKTEFSIADPHELVEWDDWGFRYKVVADHQGGIPIEWDVGIRGTSLFWQEGPYGDFWMGGMVGFGMPEPGKHEVFAILALDANELDSANAEQQLEERFNIAEALMQRTVNEDKDILNSIHYQPGTLTGGDLTLVRYFRMLRSYPRSHLSSSFIN